MIAAVSHAGALVLIGWLIVIGCVVGAAWTAFHGQVVPAILLLVVAVIAGALLL